MELLKESLVAFVLGPDRSVQAARKIESEILQSSLAREPQFEELLDMLASYRPGGGEFMYDESQLVETVKEVISFLNKTSDAEETPPK